jgi:ribonuclease P protein component
LRFRNSSFEVSFPDLPLFQKHERLCLKKDIAELFEKGQKSACFPFRIILNANYSIYQLPLFGNSENGDEEMKVPEFECKTQILISVSKRNFKNATDRNRLKRQIREAYRLKKDGFFKMINDHLPQNTNLFIHIGFIYTSKVKEPYSLIERKMEKALEEIANKIKH